VYPGTKSGHGGWLTVGNLPVIRDGPSPGPGPPEHDVSAIRAIRAIRAIKASKERSLAVLSIHAPNSQDFFIQEFYISIPLYHGTTGPTPCSQIFVPYLILILLADLVIQAYNSAILIFSISA